MRRPVRLAFVSGLAAAAGAAWLGGDAADRLSAYPDDPPPAHTGGFGEPTCRACHFGAELNAPGAVLRIEGLPAAYRPGDAYDLSVVLSGEPLPRAGFELAARFAGGAAHGAQAGELEAIGSDVAVTAAGTPTVLYAHQTLAGTDPDEPGVARWRLRWRAPAGPRGDVAFHVSANVANDDASAFGDAIYTDSAHIGVAVEKTSSHRGEPDA
ncbi:MAG: choice-of-anchor V domain-containing protein [Longimicrobiales bacterium]